jgi:hypothetical protein
VARESSVAVHDAKVGAVRMQAPTPRLSVTVGKLNFPGCSWVSTITRSATRPSARPPTISTPGVAGQLRGRVVVDVNR